MATLTVYPSLDGHLYDNGVQALTWAEIITELGSVAVDDGSSGVVMNISAKPSEADKWMTLYRSIFCFDTSVLPSNCYVSAATLSIYGKANKADSANITPDVNVYTSAPASTTALAAGDFDSLGSIALCDTPIAYGDWNEGTPGTANEFVLNADGLAAISRIGITKLGIRNASYDVAHTAPNWTSGTGSTIFCWFNEQGTTYRPKLVITYLTGEQIAGIEIVETRFHYLDAYGVERYIEGTVVP